MTDITKHTEHEAGNDHGRSTDRRMHHWGLVAATGILVLLALYLASHHVTPIFHSQNVRAAETRVATWLDAAGTRDAAGGAQWAWNWRGKTTGTTTGERGQYWNTQATSGTKPTTMSSFGEPLTTGGGTFTWTSRSPICVATVGTSGTTEREWLEATQTTTGTTVGTTSWWVPMSGAIA